MAVLSIVIGYAVGAIPISYLVGRMAGRNLLTEGSGGVSGTAAIERLGLLIGSAAGLADALKPVVVVLVAQRVGGYEVSAGAGIGSSETLVFAGWVVLGLLVVGRLVGYRKKVPPRDVSFASLFWRRLFLDRDHN